MKKQKIDLVEGVAGNSLYLNNRRIAGPKPWGGGPTIAQFTVNIDALAEALGIPAPTLAGLRSGDLVAVPRGDLGMLRLAAITTIARMQETENALTSQWGRIDAMLAAAPKGGSDAG